MVETINQGNNFIGMEYQDVTVSHDMQRVYIDGYPSFGWKYEGRGLELTSPLSMTLKFKRDRKLRNKTEITRLQRQFDACVKDISTMEKSKTLLPATIAYIIGIVGTAFMAGSVFAFISGMTTLCIILAVPAFVGWVLPYFLFNTMRRKKIAEVTPLIDSKYDELYEVCEKAGALLAQ